MFIELIDIEKAELLNFNFDTWCDKVTWKETKTKGNQKKLLHEIIKKAKAKGTIEYTFGKGKTYGRKFGLHSLQGLKKCVRNTIIQDIYADADMACAQATVLIWKAKKHNLPCEAIEKYVVTPELKQYKSTVNTIMFGATLKTTGNIEIDNFLSKLKEQSLNIGEYLLNYYTTDPNEKDIQIKAKRAKENKVGKCLANFLQYYESNILENVFNFMGETIDTTNFVKMFDGFLLPKKMMSADLLENINKHIFETMGIPVNFIEKPFDKILDTNGMVNIELCDDQLNAENLLQVLQGKIFNVKNIGLLIYDENDGLWYDDKDAHLKIFNRLSQHFIKKTKQFLKSYDPVIRILKAIAPLNENFFTDKQIGYLLFRNGILDMRNYCLLDFSPDYRFTKRIDRDFYCDDYDYLELKSKIFETMFSNQEKMDYFLYRLARGIGGNYTDNQSLFLMGNSACGKTSTITLMRKSFSGFVGDFDLEHLIKKNGMREDFERDLGWVGSIFDCRISFSSELTMVKENKSLGKLNANYFKRITGGDPVGGRMAYGKSFKEICRSMLVSVMNDVLEFDKADDAVERRCNVIWADRTSSKTIKTTNEYFFPAISPESFNEYLNSPDTWNKFIKLMCVYYKLYFEKPECVKLDTIGASGATKTEKDWIYENYDIDENGKVPFKDIYEKYQNEYPVSKIKFSRILQQFFKIAEKTEKNTNKNITYVLGITKKIETEEY